MRLPDFDRSRAVLIGTAGYDSDDLIDLPAVANNVTALRARLTDPVLSGFSPDHCSHAIDPEVPGDVLRPVKKAAEEAKDLLLVYFAGHGLLDPHGHLQLGLRRTHRDETWSSLRVGDLADLIRDSDARSKIVILDCCYSGRAMKYLFMSGDWLARRTIARRDISGLYVLTSSAANKASVARDGYEFTAFTGQLLKLIDEGLPDGRDLLTMRALYTAVRQAMGDDRLPLPQQYTRNLTSEAALFRNRAHAAGVPAVPGLKKVPRTRVVTLPAVRPAWRRAAGAGLGVVVLTATVTTAAGPSPAASCAAPTAIRMLVPPDTVEMFTDIADSYEYATRGAGYCQRVRVDIAGAARDDVTRAFQLSWRTPPGASDDDRRLMRRVGLPPDVWIADIGADMTAVQAEVAAIDGAEVRIPGGPDEWPIAESPLVLAEPGEPAGTPASRLAPSWGDLIGGRERESRLRVTGVVRPDPETTTIGRLVDVALYPPGQSAATARTRVQQTLDTAAAQAGQGIGAPDIAGLLCGTFGDAQRDTGVIVAEWQLVRHNMRHRAGGRCGGAGTWNGWYPGDTRWLDYPMVQPQWARAPGDRIRRTADAFTAWIRSPAGGKAMADHGLRPRNTGPDAGLISQNGALANWYARDGYDTGAGDLARAEKAYRMARKPATVLVAVDGSGSMTARSGGRTRFGAALDGIAASVATMGPRDDFGLFIFSSAIEGGIIEFTGAGAKTTERARGYPPAGGTPLYQAVDHGVRRLRQQREADGDDRHRILVVLTDGRDTTRHRLPRLDDDSIDVVVVNVGVSGCPDARLAALTSRHGDCVGVSSGSVDVEVGQQIERLWQKDVT
ncbi:caspase, EACC1-associated type [Actinoplanes sp. CA-252034]|uniref:caspase, EACC1-associated type n=1 Tax=Actinoplanes sp. CA-252034 TaxID=3239906 RepID=UPI003D978B42